MTKLLIALWRFVAPALGAALVAFLTYFTTKSAGGSADVQLAAGSGVFTYASWAALLGHLLDRHKVNATATIALAKIKPVGVADAENLIAAGAQGALDLLSAAGSPTSPVIAPTPVMAVPSTGTVGVATSGSWVPPTAQTPVDAP